ncbi:hypothetical protein Csp2054_01170 [Curtobacterium sp. 'Ferrero']|nr:hypothetical protein Csp2054_01170 [Curtobacterium sp. 'Ferrero']
MQEHVDEHRNHEIERTRCRSTFGGWRCELDAGHEGLHRHRDGTTLAEWSADLTGRRVGDLWGRGR